MYRPPSYPGITQRMVRCSRLMICPSEPFTFCISPFTYYWDTPPLYGFTTQMVWVAIVTAQLYLCWSKALLCFFLNCWKFFHRDSKVIFVLFFLIKAFWHVLKRKNIFFNFLPVKLNRRKELKGTSVLTLSLLNLSDSCTCQCRSVYFKHSSLRESCHWDCQDMCNIVEQ